MRPITAVLLLQAASGQGTAPPAAEVTAFVGAHVVPMDAPRVLGEQTVLVQEGRIVGMGPAAVTAVPPGARRIDARGRYLMPGLADMHVHLARRDELIADELLLYLANGVTTVRGMDGRPIHLAWRERVARGDAPGPAIRTCGPQVFGRVSPLGRVAQAPDGPGWLRWISRSRTPASAHAVALKHRRAGYDCLKIYSAPDWTNDAYAAAVAGARDAGIPLAGHFARNLPLDRNLAGRSSVDHLEEFNYTYFFRATRPGDWATRDSLLPEVARRVATSGVAVTSTLWYIHRNHVLGNGEAQVVDEPEMRFVPASHRRQLTGERRSTRAVLIDRQRASSARNLAFQRRMATAFQAAGVRLMAGTDASLRSRVVPGFSLHHELAELVAAGLEPYQALRAATATPAGVLGEPAGIVAVGLRADLLLLEGNPLEDIRTAARPLGVMANGRWWTRAELDDALRAVESRAGRR